MSPSYSDILSISRGIFKWLRQQQVVNPFFKGSTAAVRFEVARVKRTPSGDFFVSFAPSLAAASSRPRQALLSSCSLRKPRLDTSQPTFARFPITPFPFPFHRRRRSLNDYTGYAEGKRISCRWKFVVRAYTSSFESARVPRNEFIRFPSGIRGRAFSRML